MGVGVQRHDTVALPRKWPGTHCIKGWVSPTAGLEGAENLTRNGIQSQDRTTRSVLLYRRHYPGPVEYSEVIIILLGDGVCHRIFAHHKRM